MAGGTGRFGQADRLRRAGEFRRVAATGRRRAGRLVVAIEGARSGEAAIGAERRRLGVTVSRKVGGAVVRNRVKRWLREWFRCTRGRLRAGTDLVVIARSGAGASSYQALAAELDAFYTRQGREDG
jgi:ribonuclease P protein component